jgi:tRNA uridine 5-carbamoylmethylation protein Kti12
MPKFDMLIGLPASGKSTITNKHLNSSTSKTVSSDNIVEGIAKSVGVTYNEAWPHCQDFAHKICGHFTKEHVKNGHDIISDQTNLTKKSRAIKLALIPKHYTKIAHVVSTPAKEEHDHRLNNRQGKNIPEATMKQMAASYQEPTHDEGFDEIHHYDCYGNKMKISKALTPKTK